jgi:hypothetical protein
VSETENQQSGEAIVLTSPDLLLPEGQRFITSEEMFEKDKTGLPKPRFSVQEAAKVFFGAGPDWMRWRIRGSSKRIKQPDGSFISEPGEYPHGYFVLDGEVLEFRKTEAGAHYFTLLDIEKMAQALAQQRIIDGAHLTNTLTAVKAIARMYGYVS